ncbi:plasmid maintenance protein CcdB [Salmonella enterica subsp. salamae]|uniref:Toxin CcdB n=1 Tax=Salmonella enterica subsp. enterica serovar Kottbus TaxID=224727 RepID=A0A5J0SIG2_SALET|nr:plasmid maintenance protein CcdB [Salmonella enterica subsp. enterica serovar Kottbus]ECG0942756.1 plasmid maintenance protein CcdB [Salmonella enterica subsp. salamae]EDE8444950.1 plasmid maintenance protein CcdB [Salmonella enterica subsp. enterica serovar Pomona]EDJ1504587.1 plasmid maintenance protein CcdB [Salmonella enterica]EDM0594547.1 plasmid maintenance protein CcdB [Salmonella enterica subsp. enterica serovar Cerro]EDN4397072.1 plasmid maintenance protein CcdB [Salmonella enteric
MSKQFDVYRNPSAKTNRLWPFYLILQNDYFDNLTTRIVVPLVSKNDIDLTRKRINPPVKINESDFYVFTPAITFLEVKKINNKDFICNIASSRNEIISALDAIITNT